MISDSWRIIDIIKWAEAYFKKKDFKNPRLEIEWLLRSLLDYNKLDLYLKFEQILTKSQLSILKKWIKRRVKREPLQYITESCDFYGRQFFINPNVLIPRPETERLIEISLERIKSIKNPKILDIGTGSGCIASTLALERPDSIVLGIDNSQRAIRIAQINKSKLISSNVSFTKMDIFLDQPSGYYDLLVSNPPYIPKEDMKTLNEDVRLYEPHNALTDGSDGLTFYKRISKLGKSILKPRAWVVTEVGLGKHPYSVKLIFDYLKYFNVELIKDYNGDDRVLIAQV